MDYSDKRKELGNRKYQPSHRPILKDRQASQQVSRPMFEAAWPAPRSILGLVAQTTHFWLGRISQLQNMVLRLVESKEGDAWWAEAVLPCIKISNEFQLLKLGLDGMATNIAMFKWMDLQLSLNLSANVREI